MRPFTALFAAALVATATGCTATQFAKTETAIASALISEEQEKELGLQVQQELQKQGLKVSSDPVVVGYVNGLVGKLLPLAQKDRNTAFDVQVIDDPKTVNAFATPGGHLYVYTGLLLAADSEAEIVGVLGHEMGHVVARHAARQLVSMYGLQTVAALAFGKDPTLLEQVATAVVGNGTLLAHSRADENEADGFAVKYASTAGYDPRGIASFFEKLLAQQGKTPRILTWLSTHPATADRIAHVQQLIAGKGLTGGIVGTERLAPIKARLQQTQPMPVSQN